MEKEQILEWLQDQPVGVQAAILHDAANNLLACLDEEADVLERLKEKGEKYEAISDSYDLLDNIIPDLAQVRENLEEQS